MMQVVVAVVVHHLLIRSQPPRLQEELHKAPMCGLHTGPALNSKRVSAPEVPGANFLTTHRRVAKAMGRGYHHQHRMEDPAQVWRSNLVR